MSRRVRPPGMDRRPRGRQQPTGLPARPRSRTWVWSEARPGSGWSRRQRGWRRGLRVPLGRSVYFERPALRSGKNVFQRVAWSRVGLLLRPVRGLRGLLVVPLLHPGGFLGRQPPALDEPAVEARDCIVTGSFGDRL